MNVETLIQALSSFNPDAEVLVSSDAEGNRINSVYEVFDGAVESLDDSWIELIADEDLEYFEDEETIPVVVIWPV